MATTTASPRRRAVTKRPITSPLGEPSAPDGSSAGESRRSPTEARAMATRWGGNGWSESLSHELFPDIRVTLIEPGVVVSEMAGHITHKAERWRPGDM